MQLPTDRTESTIPRDPAAKWEYPSPQQFYNALVRKGWETPEEHVETMVEIHNFLNEQAWQEVLKWEKRQYGSVVVLQPCNSWLNCPGRSHDDIQLARFKGRPGEMSPKARILMLAGWVLPSRFKWVFASALPKHQTDNSPSCPAPNPLSIDMIGWFIGQRQARKFATSLIITPRLPNPMGPPCFPSTFVQLSTVSGA